MEGRMAAPYPPVRADVPDGVQGVYRIGMEVDVSVTLGPMVAGDGEDDGQVAGEVYEGIGIFEHFVIQ
ncbi:hypothetical protein V6Z90_006272 [Aspergillus fumigatus]